MPAATSPDPGAIVPVGELPPAEYDRAVHPARGALDVEPPGARLATPGSTPR